MRTWIALVALTGCWGTGPSDTIANKSADRPGLLTMRTTGFGPIDASTVATLEHLRKLFPGYEVRPVNDPNLEYDIYAGSEKLAFVVLNDDMTVFNVHATSGKISIADRTWRVGEAFQGSGDLTHCECWGDNPTCYRNGEHVAVNFKRPCDDITSAGRRGLRALDGVVVQRLIWSPSAFGVDVKSEFGGDEYGGNDPGDAP